MDEIAVGEARTATTVVAALGETIAVLFRVIVAPSAPRGGALTRSAPRERRRKRPLFRRQFGPPALGETCP